MVLIDASPRDTFAQATIGGAKMRAPLRTPSLCVGLLLLVSAQLAGQLRAITGTVTDSITGGPIAGVRVEVLDNQGELKASTRTDPRGHFRIFGLPQQGYNIVFTRLGYAVQRREGVEPAGADLTVSMMPTAVDIDPLVVSVSRTIETALEAPASVSVVDRQEIEEAASFTPVDHVRTVTGVDMATKGLTQHTYTVRGGQAVSSAALLTLMDYRYAGVPSLRLNIPYLIATTSDDIERIEVMRGPAAALYGPNSDRGVLHIVTRSPFDSRGTAISLTGGERSVFQGSLRHAGVVSDRVGFKISGEYFRGHDWEFTDTVEVRKRNELLLAGADPDTLLVGNRDYDTERFTGHARIDWRASDETLVKLMGGWAQAINNVDLTSVGGTQVRNWRYQYLQAHLEHGRLFGNVIFNASDAGDTYQLRSGSPIVDNSRVMAAQLQHSSEVAGRHELLYGVDFRRTVPRTDSTIHGRNEDSDNLNELGAYVHSTTTLTRRLDLIAALRVDYHDRINDLAISPRAALVFSPNPAHALRVTYNRAYTSPAAQSLFIDMVVDSFPIVPYAVRWRGKPKSGFNFLRACRGLCMQSPFNPAGAWSVVPADATLLWPVVVAIMETQGMDISDIPGPSPLSVSSDLRTINAVTGEFDSTTPDQVVDIEPDRRSYINVLEAGYKGVIADRLLVGLDLYMTRVSDVVGEPYAVTPNVFLNQETLELYLRDFRPPGVAADLAESITQIPLGTVSPGESEDADVILVERQGGSYTVFGADISLFAAITPEFSVGGSYSWTSKDSIVSVGQIGDVVPGMPTHKGSLELEYRNANVGLVVNAGARAVASFPVISGVYTGRVDSYAVLDASVGYRLPWMQNVRVSVDALNILDNRHQEYVGAAELGRLVVGRLRVAF